MMTGFSSIQSTRFSFWMAMRASHPIQSPGSTLLVLAARKAALQFAADIDDLAGEEELGAGAFQSHARPHSDAWRGHRAPCGRVSSALADRAGDGGAADEVAAHRRGGEDCPCPHGDSRVAGEAARARTCR